MTQPPKRGLKPHVLNRIISVMTDPAYDGLSQKEVAAKAGIHVQTLKRYLTDEVWEDIKKLRLNVVMETLEQVDRAVYAKAMRGDVSAAKLLYARWQEEQKREKDQKAVKKRTLVELNVEIERLKEEIDELEQSYQSKSAARS